MIRVKPLFIFVPQSYEVTTLDRAVVLPQDLARKFLYDAVVLKHERAFAYGGLFSVGDRVILVDRKDLPLNYVIELSDYLIIKSSQGSIDLSRRYEVKNVDEFEGGFTYLLTVTELKGLELSQINDVIIKDRFSFREQVLLETAKSGPKDTLSFAETFAYVLQRHGYHETLAFGQSISVVLNPRHDLSNVLTFTQTVVFGLFHNDGPVDILVFVQTIGLHKTLLKTISETLTFTQTVSRQSRYVLEDGSSGYTDETGDPLVT